MSNSNEKHKFYAGIVVDSACSLMLGAAIIGALLGAIVCAAV